jgi:hypothetical protein
MSFLKKIKTAFSSSQPHRADKPVCRPNTPVARIFMIGKGGVGMSTIIKQMQVSNTHTHTHTHTHAHTHTNPLQKLCLTKRDDYKHYDSEWTDVIADPMDVNYRTSYVRLMHQNALKAVTSLIEVH